MNILKIVKEWDKNAEQRYWQIKSGRDISYRCILVPTILSILGDVSSKKGIDLGCGPGILTKFIAQRAKKVVGVDFSKKMISIATSECRRVPNAIFHCSSVEHYLSKSKTSAFDFAVANMFLNTVPEIDNILERLSRVLRKEGRFIFSVAHPCFWNNYRTIIKKNKYQYTKSYSAKWKFKISLDQKGLPKPVSFFHRPLSAYSVAIRNAGFHTVRFYEPMPNERIKKLYPKKWEFPRFLFWEVLNVKGKS